MEWLRKCRLGVRVALIAKARLALLQQGRLCFEFVDTVTAGAAHKSFAMGSPLEVIVLTNVAGQAFLLHLFSRCCLREAEDLSCVPATIDMRLAGSVAAFACHALAAVLQGQSGVWIVAELL